MAGNVFEFVQDYFSSGYYGSAAKKDPINNQSSKSYSRRGGSWHAAGLYLRSSFRQTEWISGFSHVTGFRCARYAPAVCGNGNLEKGEACDDGNVKNGDGCPAACLFRLPTHGIIDAGSNWRTSCGLFNGKIRCWGDDSKGVVTKAPAGKFKQVALGLWHGCALTTTGAISCWGDNQVGSVSKAPSGVFTDISCGDWFCCALDTKKRARCWGVDAKQPTVTHCGGKEKLDFGQVGNAPSTEFVQVSAKRLQACGLTAGGKIKCWGRDDHKQVSGVPALKWKHVSMGLHNACGVTTGGTLKCWGKAGGLLTVPTGTFVQVDAGDQHACALRSNGTASCWGDATDSRVKAPAQKFVEVRASEVHSCGLSAGGQVVCWGCDSLDKGQCTVP